MPHNTFTHALARVPTLNMGDGLTTQDLGEPDVALAIEQHAAYCGALRECGLDVTILAGDAAYPDACFVEDTAVIYGDLVVITQPGAPSRQGETEAIQKVFGNRTVMRLTGDEYLEGGDVLVCADRILIGLSGRTNQGGAERLRGWLQEYQTDLKVDFVPVAGVLHLKTGLTELAPGVLLKSPDFETDYPFDFAETHTLSDSEKYAANVLPINGSLLVHAGYSSVLKLAERYCNRVLPIQMSEFEKMDGSLTCLSLRYSI